MGWPLRLFAKRRTDNATTGCYIHTLSALERFITNLRGWDIYVTLNPSTGGGVKASDSQITEVRWILADLDPITVPGGPPALLKWTCYPHMPNVFTGRGVQVWVPVEPGPPVPSWSSAAYEFLMDLIPPKPHQKLDRTTEPSRVARMPGTINSRTGQESAILNLMDGPWTLWAREEIISRIPPPPPPLPQAPPPRDIMAALPPRVSDFLTMGTSHPGRHSACYAAGAALAEVGVPLDRALELVHTANSYSYPRPIDSYEAERAARNGYRKGLSRENLYG